VLQLVQRIRLGRGKLLRLDGDGGAVPVEPHLGQLDLVDHRPPPDVQQRLDRVRRGELQRRRQRGRPGQRAGPAGEHDGAEARRLRQRRHVVDAEHRRRVLVLLGVGQGPRHLVPGGGEYEYVAGAVGGVVDRHGPDPRSEVQVAGDAAGGECTGDLGRAGGGHRDLHTSVCALG